MGSQTITLGVTTRSPQTVDYALLSGVAISSCAAMLLELALTRLFSVVLFYHFAFLAISIALLGLGSGGVFAHLGKRGLARFQTRPLLARLSLVNAAVVPIVLEVVLHARVSLIFSKGNFLRLTLVYICSAVPFFLTGLGFSVVFAREFGEIPRLYGADLLGAALACVGIVPFLNWQGGPNTVLFAGLIAAVAGLVWADTARMRKLAGSLVVALLLVMAANHSEKLIDIVYAKGVLQNPLSVEFARWNAISRVEVDRRGEAKVLVIDADASSRIMNADPARWQQTPSEKKLMSEAPAVANMLRPHGEYAIIGPGGGVDVLRALANGSPSVTGIEINPIIANTIMRERYAGYSGHLYDRPDVHIQVTDGRSFVRNTTQRFDVVQMTLVDTWASTAAGAFALSENNLYTMEAFREYFTHLKPDGMIAVTRWEFREPREALRVVSVALEALHQLGVENTSKNFIVVSKGDLNEDGIPVAVLAKKSAFTPEEEQRVQDGLQNNPPLVALYLPSRPGSNAFSALIVGNNAYAFAKQYPYNVTPVTDNAPFFFFTLKLGQVIHEWGSGRGEDWKVNLGVAVLATVTIISFLAVLAFLLIPLVVRGRSSRVHPMRLLYFVAVGLGYILVEITFIQRFVLFLGHPTYALTVVVFLLLLSSGAGSLASRKWLIQTGGAWLPLILIVGALLLYVFILPGLLSGLVGIPFFAKLLVSAGLLVPLGFAMGMPFPTGLRALSNFPWVMDSGQDSDSIQESAVEWAWAMNAGASVLGSALAMAIAIQFGLNATLACGATAYAVAIMLSRTLHPKH